MKMNGKSKKLIVGLAGFCMAAVIFAGEIMTNVTDVQATTKVFDAITDRYKDSNTFTILEIEPDESSYSFTDEQQINVSKHAELGYFSSTSNRRRYGGGDGLGGGLPNAALGGVHGSPATGYNDVDYASQIYQLRMYGLVKPNGMDSQGISTGIAEYPMFAEVAIFSDYYNNMTSHRYDQKDCFAKGVYTMVESGGDYQLRDGYKLDDSGRICRVTVSTNEVPIMEKDVSGNDVQTGTKIEETEILEPVTDIDETKLQLPTSATDGIPYITQVQGTGNLTFKRSEKATTMQEYYGITDLALYYATDIQGKKFYNSDWFKEYVLGSNKKYANMKINYKMVAASKVTTADIDSADLIYINGTYQSFVKGNNDLSMVIMAYLYNQVVQNHKALMMDYAGYDASLSNNISKLALLLWQEGQSSVVTAAKDTGIFNSTTSELVDPDGLFKKTDIINNLKDSILSGGNGNFVSGNVYVYNHHMSDFVAAKSLVDALDNFANGDFNTPYSAAVASSGFSPVVSYINATNKNSTSGSMSTNVTPAVAIQYILVNDGTGISVVKNNLRILEIEPTTNFLYSEKYGVEEYSDFDDYSEFKKNRDDFVSNYLSAFYSDKAKYIEFESMTIDEFNGRNDDLIENYDIIYIGSETGKSNNKSLFYTNKIKTRDVKDGIYDSAKFVERDLPAYNDGYMTGMVYYNIGDTVKVKSQLKGYLDTDTDVVRYAGRDLTKNKLKKLEAYLEAKGLLIVAGDMYGPVTTKDNLVVNPTAVTDGNETDRDHGRVDNSSNMYELLMFGCGKLYNTATGQYEDNSGSTQYTKYENMISTSMITAKSIEKDLINKYVATEKLVLTVNSQPQEYMYERKQNSEVIDPDKVKYLEQNADGSRTMTFEFNIASDSSDPTMNATYQPHLYIDINNDGKYSSTTEDIKDIVVSVKGTGAEAEKNADGNYVLNKDVEYVLKRDVSNEYSGLLKWKLDVQSYQYQNAHDSAEGYTLAANITGEDKICKILQLTNNTGSNLNLEAQLADPNSKFGKYLQNVPGYTVEIKTVTVSEFEKDFVAKYSAYAASASTDANGNTATKKSLKEYALDYFNSIEIKAPEKDKDDKVTKEGVYGANMLVLGFGDNFANFSSDDAIAAVESYMESGKPTLLTHDFIMFFSNYKQAKRLRNLVGMDRYGMTQNIIAESDGTKITVKELVNAATSSSGVKYLHSSNDYTRAQNASEIMTIEATGKTVAYQPGKGRQTVLRTTQGVNNTTAVRFMNSTGDKYWINSNKANRDKNESGADSYTVNKLNEGQLTIYPYVLPDQFKVTTTHSQYFQLDMDTDDDGDGESDVVVWYTLGGNGHDFDPYADNVGGPMASDGYYIYNKGNITYTGAGHSSLENASETEAQLFVNTLFASFTASYTEPSVGFFETPNPNAAAITSISIPYDKNVTNPDGTTAIDSSILTNSNGVRKYQFVDPNTNASVDATTSGTPIYFRLNDTNFVRGTKYMAIQYYLKLDGMKKDDVVTLNDNSAVKVEEKVINKVTVPVVNISKVIKTYSVANNQLNTEIARDANGKVSNLESMTTYGFYLPLSYLNTTGEFTIYLEAQTTINSVSSITGETTTTVVPELGYQELTVTKTDLLDLD